MRSSPRSRTRSGSLSARGSSSDLAAGIQYWRIRSPIGVPGPMRVRYSLSCLLSMRLPAALHAYAAARRATLHTRDVDNQRAAGLACLVLLLHVLDHVPHMIT